MARTRQKAKQRKAKRLEQQRKAAERADGADDPKAAAAPASAPDAAAEVEEAQQEAAAELQEAQRAAEAASGPEAAPVPAREAAPQKAERRERRKVEDKERGKTPPTPRAERKREARPRGRVVNFFIQVWAELRRVQWPDRNQVTQATTVVVVFCLIAGGYLAIWDFFFSKLIKSLL